MMGFSPAKWILYQNWVNTVKLVIWARKTQVISCPQIVLNFCAYNFGAKHQYLMIFAKRSRRSDDLK